MGAVLPTFLALSLSLFLLWVVKLARSLWWKPRKLEKSLRLQGLRGSSYRFLFGDLKELGAAMKEAWSKPMNLDHQILPRVLPFDHQAVQRHGKVCLTWLGTTPRVILQDPELVKQVLSNIGFQKPPIIPVLKQLGMGITSLEGDEWVQRRKLINPSFHLEKLKGMLPDVSECCAQLIKRWGDMASSGGSCELDVWPELQTFALDVISRTAFSSSYQEGQKIFELQKEQIPLVIEAVTASFIPGFRFLPTKTNRRRAYLDEEIRRLLRDLIHAKEMSMKMGQSSSNNDLLGLLLEANHHDSLHEHEDEPENTASLTVEQIIEECKVFYVAGQETTAALLTWTMILLSMHPRWQEQAREEVLRVCGKAFPDFESFNHLKIVTMILHEVLRLYPSVIALYRHTYKDMKVGEMVLPAGVDLLLPTLLIHHDHELWGEDAEEFKPERFSEGISKASKKQNAFFPFGWGPRICIGQNFAMMEAKLALAVILQHFSFQLSSSYIHAPYTVITLQPQYGAQLIVHQL